MRPEKALAILEGKVPHKEIHEDHADDKERVFKEDAAADAREPVRKSFDFVKVFLGISILTGLAGGYLWSMVRISDQSYKSGLNDGAASAAGKAAADDQINEKFKQIDDLKQDLAQARRELAGVNQKKEQLEDALKESRKPKGIVRPKAVPQAIPVYDQTVQAYLARGIAYEGQGNYTKALADFNRTVKIDHNCASCFYRRGDIYYLKGNRSHAFANWNKALRLDSQNPASGITYYSKVRPDRAIADNTKVIRVYPRYPLAYYTRATAYAAKGRHDKAIADFSKAIELDPKYVEAYSNRAVSYFLRQDYGRALDDAQIVRQSGGRINPDFLTSLQTASGKDNQDWKKISSY